MGSGATQSNIFGGAKPVDTVKKKEEKERAAEEARKNKPSAASIFGGAKPVDTTQREKEIEDKISKLTVSKDEKKEEKPPVENAWRRRDDGEAPKSAAYRPPGRRDEGDQRRDDRGYDRGYDRDRRDDRGYDRDRRDDRGYDRDRRDDRGNDRDRGYDSG